MFDFSAIQFVDIIEFIGTFAFAISGVRLASAKKFDLFGAYVVGLCTAVGGGTLRDLLLGVTPFWMNNTFYLWCTLFALIFVMIFHNHLIRLDSAFFVFDSIGLALFVVVGAEKTLNLGFAPWVAVIMGTSTGAVGGIIRDVLINEIPLIFRREIYALACVVGGIVFVTLSVKFDLNLMFIELITAAVVILIRFLSVKYRLSLPVLKGERRDLLKH